MSGNSRRGSTSGHSSDHSAEDQLPHGQDKRVMANRKSAQRSRIRKLQWFAELEQEVNDVANDLRAIIHQLPELRSRYKSLYARNKELQSYYSQLASRKKQRVKECAAAVGHGCQGLPAATACQPHTMSINADNEHDAGFDHLMDQLLGLPVAQDVQWAPGNFQPEPQLMHLQQPHQTVYHGHHLPQVHQSLDDELDELTNTLEAGLYGQEAHRRLPLDVMSLAVPQHAQHMGTSTYQQQHGHQHFEMPEAEDVDIPMEFLQQVVLGSPTHKAQGVNGNNDARWTPIPDYAFRHQEQLYTDGLDELYGL